MLNEDELMDVFGVEDIAHVRMIFCYIPWMKYYLGESDEDTIPEDTGGGPVTEEVEGNEATLFYPGVIDDEACLAGIAFPGRHHNAFGYVEYKKLDLENHFKGQVQDIVTNQCVDDVVVVWVAQQHKTVAKKTDPVIVGWWKYATILRDYEEMAIGDGDEFRLFNVMASSDDAFLLDIEHRNFKVGHKVTEGVGFGQSNIWYADKLEDLSFRDEVLSYISKCEKEGLNRLMDFYDEFIIEELE